MSIQVLAFVIIAASFFNFAKASFIRTSTILPDPGSGSFKKVIAAAESSTSGSSNKDSSGGSNSNNNSHGLFGSFGNKSSSGETQQKKKSSIFPAFDFMSKFFSGALQLFITDVDVLKLVSRICALTVWLALALSVAGSLGFDTKPLLGLASVAFISIGIGAKDLISNTIAGLFVAFARPFRRGSHITIHAPHGLTFSGRVLAINMRYLRLQQQATKGTTLIPLSFCLNKPITVEEL